MIPLKEKGFSGKELVIVLAVISFLIGSAFPLFYRLRAKTSEKRFLETVELVKGGLAAWKTRQVISDTKPSYPEALDDEPLGETCDACFENILPKGLHDAAWFKDASGNYLYSLDGNKTYFLKYESQEGQITTGNLSQ